MKKYKDIYPWNVDKEIKKGNTVYCLDKSGEVVGDNIFIVNNLSVEEFYKHEKQFEDDKQNTFSFWIIEENEGDSNVCS